MIEAKKHAKFSASNAYRWLACPGSIGLCEKAPPEKESPAALEGTLTHECLEGYLKNGHGKMLTTGQFLRGKHPMERIVRAEIAAKAIWNMAPKGSQILSETKSSLAHIHPDMYGTADAVIVEDFGTLHVIDYKNGRMPVEVKNNPQLIFYALGIAHQYDYNFEEIGLVVIQPLANHPEGPNRKWVVEADRIRDWEMTFRKGVLAASKKNAPFNAGEHCFFCPAKSICKAYTPDAIRSMRAKFVKPKTLEQRKNQLALDFGAYVGNTKDTKTERKPLGF